MATSTYFIKANLLYITLVELMQPLNRVNHDGYKHEFAKLEKCMYMMHLTLTLKYITVESAIFHDL